MFTLCYGTGASTGEVSSLNLSDYHPGVPCVRLGHDQGAFKDRVVWLAPEAANIVAGWLALRRREPGPLFYSLDRFGTVRNHQITNATIHAALRQRFKQAVLSPIVPEDLRRTGLTRFFEHGADIYSVADLAGHRTLEETERYEPDPSVPHAPATSHGETPFHSW